MSKKELLEFAQTAHGENVKLMQQLAKANERVRELEKRSSPLLKTEDGLHSKESCDAAMIGQLRNQLAKANERVKELTKENLSIVNGVNKYTFDDVKVDFVAELNKFAIEQKIEAFNEWLYEVKYMEGVSARDLVDSAVEFLEQLRKEQLK
ncbi:hypothetical protein [Pseudorhizobium pelagicum]|nr:hypothetical protein [Pseudorhizobium pelagicum]